jgi:hypothetical protein
MNELAPTYPSLLSPHDSNNNSKLLPSFLFITEPPPPPPSFSFKFDMQGNNLLLHFILTMGK